VKSEELPQKTLNAISLYCGTYLLACRYSQALIIGSAGEDENLEMFCALTFSIV